MELEALHNCCKHGELMVACPELWRSYLQWHMALHQGRSDIEGKMINDMTGFENVSRYCYWSPGTGDDNNDGDDKSDRGRRGTFF